MSNLIIILLSWQILLAQTLNKPLLATQRKRQADNECEDMVEIKDCDYSGNLKFFRIKTNQLVAHLETKCKKFDSIKYRWQVTDSSQHKPVIDQETDNVFILNPFVLKKGANAINLEVTVTRGATKSNIHGGCEVEMVALDPIPTIDGGSEITVEANQRFALDGSKSIDRDVAFDAAKTLAYEWRCEVISGNTKDFCSKTYQGDTLQVPSSYAVINHKYIFTLSVRNQNSDKWLSSTQTVTVAKNVAVLEIVCEKNCPPAAPTTNSKRLTFLRVKCLRNCGRVTESSYTWSVEGDFDYDKTQFGRNTDKFVVKEGVFESGKTYTVRVSLKDPEGNAGKVLQVPSPLKIQNCEVKPKEGVAAEMMFMVDCKYEGVGYSFEVLTKKDGKSVVLTQNYFLENVAFVLPPQAEVFIRITDINDFQDVYKLDVNVQPSSKQVSTILASIKESITNGDTDSAIQTINAIIDQIPKSDAKMTKKTLLEDLAKIKIKTQINARQVASIVAKLVSDPDAKSDPYQGEAVTKICKRASEVDLEYMKKEYYPTTLTSDAQESSQTLLSCGETDSKENFDVLTPVPLVFNVTTPFPVLDVPVIAENYPDYDDDESVGAKRKMYAETSHNIVAICENSLRMLNLTAVEGEETIVATTNSTAAQVTRLAGTKLSKTEIEIQGAVFSASPDFDGIKQTVDVTICSWNYDPFWWNPAKTIVSTGVLLIRLVKNGEEQKKFYKPNRLVFDLREQNLKSEEVVVDSLLPVRIDVKKDQSFFIRFHNLSESDSLKALVTSFEKPGADRVVKEGKAITKSENFVFQEETRGYDSWYYLSLESEKVTQQGNVSISVSTKSCYSWDFAAKSWIFACRGSSHSGAEKMECLCDHFSILAGVVYNNRFKIDRVLTDNDFEMVLIRSLIIYIALGTIFFIYCMLIVIAVKFAKNKNKIVYLPGDISSSARFVYLVCIQTGPKSSSGTSSNICMKIYGDRSRSKSHVLNYPDPRKEILQRNNADWFVLPTDHHLGNLQEVVLWSDFSGRNPRWFCSHVMVYDLQNDKEWYFEVDAWFDLPPKGEIFRKVAASERRKTKRRCVLRVFPKRRHQAGFSCMRRLSVLLSIFLTIFVTCLLMYGLPALTLRDGFAISEEYRFDSMIIWIAFASSMITFSTHMIWIFLFRTKNGKNLSWFLLTVNIIASMTILIIYGFWIPQITGYSWLTSCLISAIFYFLIWENLCDLLTDFFHQKSPTFVNENLKKVLPWMEEHRVRLFQIFGENLLRPYFTHLYRPMDDENIKECRRRIEVRNRLLALLEDTIMFMCYVTLLYLAIFSNKNAMTVGNHHQMVKLLSGSHTRTMDYSTIDSMDGIYQYINDSLIPTMHGHQWYAHFVIKDPGLMLDFHNKFLGVARLRQQRVVFEPCQVPRMVRPNATCRSEFWHSEESTMRFAPDNGTLERLSQIWNYTGSKYAGISVYVGKFGIYHGGGFVAPLGRTWHNSYANLLYLKDHSWLDKASSVIMIEFLAYNVNTNLFNAVKVVVERSSTGYFRTTLDLSTAQFLFVNSEEKTVHLVIFVSFVIVVGIFTVKFAVRIVRGRLLVWTDLWTLVDLIIVGLSLACFVIFIHRGETVKRFLDRVETVKKNEFINYFNLLYEDSTFTLVAAFLVFVATVRLWKVCRFGTVFKIMENTILLSICPIISVLFSHIIIISAFTFTGSVLFGTISANFRDIPDTLLTLMLLMVGMQDHFDFDSLIDSNPHLAEAYYFSYMLLNMLFLTIYICVIMLCYYEAQVAFNEESAKILQFLRKEYVFYKTSMRVVAARLRGGTQTRKFVTPKGDDLRFADCKTLPSNTLELMRCVAIYELKKFRMTEQQRLSVMRSVVKCCDGDGGNEIFFSGNENDGVRIVSDDRVREVAAAAEMILEYDEKKKERMNRRYKRAVEQQLVQLNFIKRVVETVTRIVANIHLH